MARPRPSTVRLSSEYEQDWRSQALCGPNVAKEEDWLLFTATRVKTADQKRIIKDYCRECPVRGRCRRWADGDGFFIGVAGGRIYRGLPTGGKSRPIKVED